MRPVENLPGRQASRALINLLLPRYQIHQQLMAARCASGHLSRQPIARRCSLPLLASSASQKPRQDSTALERFYQEPTSMQGTAANSGSGSPGCRRRGARPASVAWVAVDAGDGSASSENGEEERGQCGGGSGGKGGAERPILEEGAAGDRNAALPTVAALPAGIGPVKLLRVSPSNGQLPTPGSSVPAPTKSTRTTADTSFRTLAKKNSVAGMMIQESRRLPTPKRKPQRSESLPLVASSTFARIETFERSRSGVASGTEGPKISESQSTSWDTKYGGVRSAEDGEQLEETWEAFYFYHSGGMKVGELRL